MSYAAKITGIGTNWNNNNINGVEKWVAGDLGYIDIYTYAYLDIQSSFGKKYI